MRLHGLVAALGLTLVSLPATQAGASDIDKIREELSQLEQLMQELERNYLNPHLVQQNRELSERLAEGQLFYHQKDFLRAAMVLLDLVEDPRTSAHPAWHEALYFLAESLYQLRNYGAAAPYFSRIVETSTEIIRKQRAIGRLLDISTETQNQEASRRYLTLASQQMGLSPDSQLLYAVGKYHYKAGDLAQARSTLQLITPESPLYLRAKYFLAVSDVRANALDAALQGFQEIIEHNAKRERDSELAVDDAPIADLASMGRARIFYELGRFEEANAAYAVVSRDSPHFDDSLYESVWIGVKQEEFEIALRKLEILLISEPDVVKKPSARLLQGKLLLLLMRYNDASLAFREVLFEFTPIQNEMQSIMRRLGGNMVAYFNERIGEGIEDFDLASFLPPRAAEFAGPDVEADRALSIVRDLASEQRDLREADETIDQLEVALKGGSRIEMFPKLHEGWLKAVELNSRLVLLRCELNRIAAEKGAAAGQPEYDQYRQVREEWQLKFQAVPITAIQLKARDAEVDREMLRVDKEAFNMGIQLGAVEAQLVAIETYLTDLATLGTPSPQQAQILEQVNRELDELRKLRDEFKGLSEAIANERTLVGVGDEATTEDERIRMRVVAALDAEERWLAAHGSPPAAGERRRLDDVDARSRAFLTQAGVLIEGKVGEIRETLARERRNVRGYESELSGFQGETESLGGEIAAQSFRRVQDRVSDVILEADVGLIDVAWKQKDDQSKAITKILGHQRDEIEQLDGAMREVRGD